MHKDTQWFMGLLLTAALALPAAAHAQTGTPTRAMLGQKIPNLTFKTEKGDTFALHSLKERKAIVLVFLSFECPVANSYAEPLAEIEKEFARVGVSCLGLIPNDDLSPKEVARQAREFSMNFPVFVDFDLLAAKALKAEKTPEVFVLDGDFVLRYRGRIDNQYYARLKKNHQVTAHELRQVLGELLSGRPVLTPSTESVGCPIQLEAKATPKTGAVTYHRDVLPILQHNCQSCHRPGEAGPFALLTYRQAVNWADDIVTYTQSRQMPPWKPSAGVAFHHERKLSDKDLLTLKRWAELGCPEGDPREAPAARVFADGWQLGQPDIVLTMPNEFQLGPNGGDLFRCFTLPTNLPEDSYVAAVEVRPGNPRVVHHALLFVDTNKQARKLEQDFQAKKLPLDPSHPQANLDVGPGYTVNMGVGFIPQGGLGGWAPGQITLKLPDGYGFPLPKGADVVLQVHYHRNGKLEKDRTTVGFYLAKKAGTQPYLGHVLAGGNPKAAGVGRLFFMIPAGAASHKLSGSLWATEDCTLFSVMPHMHKLGKQIKVTLTTPEGKSDTLIAINDWDYNWQETYFLKQPLAIKAGSRLDVEAIYDNSAKNPNNPSNPPKLVTFGEQTTNEMCFVFLGGTSQQPQLRRLPFTANPPKDKTE